MKYRNSRTAESVARFWGKTLNNRDWYEIKAQGDSAEVMIYDVIGWPFVDADTFVRDLNRIESSHITVAINSPGGDVFDGTAIFNALRNHPAKITTRIDGIAASMASIIALAGDEVQMAENAYYMIHNPWSFAIGDEHDMRKEADLLAKIGGTLAKTYSDRTGRDIDDVKEMMDDETWFTGIEAVESGFIDRTTDGDAKAKAHFDLGMYSNAPRNIASNPRNFSDDPPSEREFERLLRDSGFSRSQAVSIVANSYQAITQRDAVENALQSIETLTANMRN